MNLTWDRVHLDDGYTQLTQTKGRRDRLQPLVLDVVAMLRELLADVSMVVVDGRAQPKEPLVFRALRWNTNRQFDKIKAAAGVPRALMKPLRITACTDAADAGFDVSQAGDFLGHADCKVTRRHYMVRQLESKRRLTESPAARLRSARRYSSDDDTKTNRRKYRTHDGLTHRAGEDSNLRPSD